MISIHLRDDEGDIGLHAKVLGVAEHELSRLRECHFHLACNDCVERGEDDDVEALVGVADEGARVVVDHRHAWRRVRMLRMEPDAEADDQRIDVDRRDVLGAVAQRGGDVVAHPRAEHEHVVRMRRETIGDVEAVQLERNPAEELRVRTHELRREAQLTQPRGGGLGRHLLETQRAVEHLAENAHHALLGQRLRPGDLQPTVDLVVKETVPGIKGATASAQIKPATLETGLVINVPSFVNEGDRVRVNTETGEYQSRV